MEHDHSRSSIPAVEDRTAIDLHSGPDTGDWETMRCEAYGDDGETVQVDFVGGTNSGIPQGARCIVSGPDGAGKSVFLSGMALGYAAGVNPFTNQPCAPTNVAIWNTEYTLPVVSGMCLTTAASLGYEPQAGVHTRWPGCDGQPFDIASPDCWGSRGTGPGNQQMITRRADESVISKARQEADKYGGEWEDYVQGVLDKTWDGVLRYVGGGQVRAHWTVVTGFNPNQPTPGHQADWMLEMVRKHDIGLVVLGPIDKMIGAHNFGDQGKGDQRAHLIRELVDEMRSLPSNPAVILEAHEPKSGGGLPKGTGWTQWCDAHFHMEVKKHHGKPVSMSLKPGRTVRAFGYDLNIPTYWKSNGVAYTPVIDEDDDLDGLRERILTAAVTAHDRLGPDFGLQKHVANEMFGGEPKNAASAFSKALKKASLTWPEVLAYANQNA